MPILQQKIGYLSVFYQKMKNLVADIGNTCAKLAIYADMQILSDVVVASHEQMATAAIALCKQHNVEQGIYSSVAAANICENFASAMNSAHLQLKPLTANLQMPFSIAYQTPQTLGADRLAAVAGAVSQFPHQNLLIIDAGTAITYEYVSENGTYLGGNISPGINIRFKALNLLTGKLPISDASHYNSPIGQSTLSAIAAGVLRGVQHEVNGVIDDFLGTEQNNRAIILTGGDYKYLALKVKSCIFARPNIVMDGIAKLCMMNFGT